MVASRITIKTMAKWCKVPEHEVRGSPLHGFAGWLPTSLIVSIVGLLLVVAVCATPRSSVADSDYRTYHNAHFGFSIQYPQSFRWSEADNGDGVWFAAPGTGADLSASFPTPIGEAAALLEMRQLFGSGA